MKKMLLLCSVALVLLTASVASAKTSPYKNLITAANWSNTPAASDYKNLRAAANWSRSAKPLSGLIKKGARFSRVQDPIQDPWLDDEMFGDEAYGYPRTWKYCVKTCVTSAMQGTGQTCIMGCASCATGSVWGCAICASCGVVGFAAIEFCTLHCCVNPGCPAMTESAY
jgi:hypothetical protein